MATVNPIALACIITHSDLTGVLLFLLTSLVAINFLLLLNHLTGCLTRLSVCVSENRICRAH